MRLSRRGHHACVFRNRSTEITVILNPVSAETFRKPVPLPRVRSVIFRSDCLTYQDGIDRDDR
jgi:hypothetical protein